jgi:DNA-binding MarR family transcriptional regulator
MIMQRSIKVIRSFTRFYKEMVSQWDKSLLCKGYTVREIKLLLELKLLGVCTVRELASRLDERIEKVVAALRILKRAGLVLVEIESDQRFNIVSLTACGNDVAKRFQQRYEDNIALRLGRMANEDREELTGLLVKAKDIFEKEGMDR